MLIKIVTLENKEESLEAISEKITSSLKSIGILGENSPISQFWIVQGQFAFENKEKFDAYLSELSFPINQKEYDFLSQDDNWRKFTFSVYEAYTYRLIHIPKTAGRYINKKYAVFREGPNQNHVTFKTQQAKNYEATTGLGRYNFARTLEDPEDINIAKQRFTVVRNPYDWLVSLYFCDWDSRAQRGWADVRDLMKEHAEDSFEAFIDVICDKKYNRTLLYKKIVEEVFPFDEGMTTQLFDNHQRLHVSNIIFFEKIHDGVKELGLMERQDSIFMIKGHGQEEFNIHKKHDPCSLRKDDYREYYTPDMIKKVAQAFKFDLEFLGYGFDGLRHDANLFTYPPGIQKSELPLLPI